jgi:hypothetical protein
MSMCNNDSAELKAIYDSILNLLERQSFEDSCHVLVHVLFRHRPCRADEK